MALLHSKVKICGLRVVGLSVGTLAFLQMLDSEVLAQAPNPDVNRTNAVIRQTDALNAANALKKPVPAEKPADEVAPETYPGENADLGPQVLLKQKKKRDPLFEFSSDTMFMWTSNALTAGWSDPANGPRDTGIVAETLSLAFAPKAWDVGSGKLSLRTGYRQVFWVYDVRDRVPINPELGYNGLNLNNFQVSTIFTNARYSFAENWAASFGVDYTRVMNQSPAQDWKIQNFGDTSNFWKESYKDINPNWSLDRSIALGEKAGISLTYSGGYHFSELPTAFPNSSSLGSSYLDKLDNAFTVGFAYLPSQTWMIQPSTRFLHCLFTRTQSASDPGERRRTTSVSPSLTVMWMPKPSLSVRLSTSADFFRSNDSDQPSYNKYDASVGFSINLKF
jgi:hypothetical protein